MRALCKALFGDVHNVVAVGVVMATGVALIRAVAGAATVYPISLLILAGVAWLAKPQLSPFSRGLRSDNNPWTKAILPDYFGTLM